MPGEPRGEFDGWQHNPPEEMIDITTPENQMVITRNVQAISERISQWRANETTVNVAGSPSNNFAVNNVTGEIVDASQYAPADRDHLGAFTFSFIRGTAAPGKVPIIDEDTVKFSPISLGDRPRSITYAVIRRYNSRQDESSNPAANEGEGSTPTE